MSIFNFRPYVIAFCLYVCFVALCFGSFIFSLHLAASYVHRNCQQGIMYCVGQMFSSFQEGVLDGQESIGQDKSKTWEHPRGN
jgi:hypothetical protein